MTGEIYLKETGEPLKDSEGYIISSSKTFVADSESGFVDVEFFIDSTLISGMTLVAFEYLTCDGITVAIHSDLNDLNQTVFVPSITTNAIQESTSSKFVQALENVILTDYISYHNISTSSDLRIVGNIVDKDTGDIIKTKEFVVICDDLDGVLEL